MPTLSQQETAIRAAAYKGFYFVAGVNPTVNDDRNKSFIFGSRWLNTVAQEEFVCIANEPGAAVWLSTTSGGGGSGIAPHIAIVNPTVNDDSGDGYVVGQLWLNTALEECYIAMDVTVAAAVWTQLNGGGSGTGAHVATVDPTVNDDSGDGYVLGQLWINTTTDTVFCAADVTVGAAVWMNLSSGAGSGTINAYQRSIASVAIAAARSGVAHTPQLMYDGFADGCLDTDGVNVGTTTYVISNNTFTNQAAPVEVRASGTVSANTEYNATYSADKAVDASDATRWSSLSTGANWYKIDFGVGNTKRITSIVIKRSQYDGGWTPVVESSNDNSSWNTEYTHTALANGPVDNTQVTFSFTPSAAKRYWRVSGTWSAQNATWNDFKIYEENYVSSPVYESMSRAMPYRPIKATVVIAAYINTLTLNTDFVAKFSSNGGTDYEVVTLTEICAAPYGATVKLYAGTITTVDRGTQSVRIKIEGTATPHNIYGVAFVGHQNVELVSNEVTAEAVDIIAAPASNNAGTNVQAQLDNINNAIANVFFMGRLLSLAATVPTILSYQTIFQVPSPYFIPSFNTLAL